MRLPLLPPFPPKIYSVFKMQILMQIVLKWKEMLFTISETSLDVTCSKSDAQLKWVLTDAL